MIGQKFGKLNDSKLDFAFLMGVDAKISIITDNVLQCILTAYPSF
jgi:hypothetical protein